MNRRGFFGRILRGAAAVAAAPAAKALADALPEVPPVAEVPVVVPPEPTPEAIAWDTSLRIVRGRPFEMPLSYASSADMWKTPSTGYVHSFTFDHDSTRFSPLGDAWS